MPASLVEKTQDSILADLCLHAQQRLALLLQRMFDQLDDVLFELADQSQNHAQQNLYFESMRDIRIKRRYIEQHFTHTLEALFTALVDEVEPFDIAQRQDALFGTGLPDKYEQDDKLMIDAMIAKALSAYPLPLAQLTARLDSMITLKLESKQNPVGPYLLAQAFFQASAQLNISSKAKSIYFTAFDRCVLESLADVTTLCNTILYEQKILPHLEVEVQPQPMYDDSKLYAQSGHLGVEQLLKDALDLDQASTTLSSTFLDKNNQSHTDEPSRSQKLQVIRPLGYGKLLDKITIVSALAEIQQQQYEQWEPLLNRDKMALLPEFSDLDAIQLVDEVLARSDMSEVHIDSLDSELINLVKMLFQFVIEDNNLSPVIKSLISCLYIPIMKVALIDPSFFSQSGHPARQLLNEIATSALGWSPVSIEKSDPFAQEIIDVVDTILSHFDQDVECFNRALESFKTFVEIDTRNTSLLEQRLVDAEGGKAKSESTRHKIQRLIDSTLENQNPPSVVESFLRTMWSNVLFVNRLKYGKQSSKFTSVINIMDRLLWSVRPAEMFNSRQELMSELPKLLKNLRENLNEIDIDGLDQNHFFAELEAIHLSRIKSAISQQPKDSKFEKSQNTNTDTHGNTLITEEPINNELKNQESNNENQNDIDEQALLKVNAMVVGGWLDFIDGDKHTRCRLAAKIKPTGMFLFVNRQGKKMAEYTADELARLVQQKQVNILDDGLLFDRALESVIGSLRK